MRKKLIELSKMIMSGVTESQKDRMLKSWEKALESYAADMHYEDERKGLADIVNDGLAEDYYRDPKNWN
jgi:hypothetical protein